MQTLMSYRRALLLARLGCPPLLSPLPLRLFLMDYFEMTKLFLNAS